MSKAKLIKKDSPKQEELKMRRKSRRQRSQPTATPTRNAIQMTTDWLKTKRAETVNARDAFAALFTEADPQSA